MKSILPRRVYENSAPVPVELKQNAETDRELARQKRQSLLSRNIAACKRAFLGSGLELLGEDAKVQNG